MKRIYHLLERVFEKFTSLATAILGNSITFIVAFGLVIFWLSNKKFYEQDIYDSIRDIIHGVIFLSLFIIQKSFSHFTTSLHIKVNELVATHEPANNEVITVEHRTEHEMAELSKEYTVLAKKKE